MTTTHPHAIDNLPPTRAAALERAARIRPAMYARTRNHLDGAVTGMSPYLTHGVLTLRNVLANVLNRGPLPVEHKLVFELGWREFFRHCWLHAGGAIFQSMHPGPLPDDCYATELPDDIRTACTGVPAIDEAVRTLYATGTLHNHARMWLASYVVHVRHVQWRVGADWLVAHYAPETWHSPGTVIDRSYEDMDRIARSSSLQALPPAGGLVTRLNPTSEPELHNAPPMALGVNPPDAQAIAKLAGRDVWLVHPWALRAPPSDVAADVVVLGVYLREHHNQWHWTHARWHWVDAAMAGVTQQRWWVDAAGLAAALAGASRVRSVADPHITRWLEDVAQLDPAPALFPVAERHCNSFSQWWTRTTRGLKSAEELL